MMDSVETKKYLKRKQLGLCSVRSSLTALCPIIVFVVITLLVNRNVFSQDVTRSTEPQRIWSIRVMGNRLITRSQVLSKVRSSTGDYFDPQTADEDCIRIAEYDGVERCYYNTAEVNGKFELTFVVVEKNLVRSIEFHGNKRVKKSTLKTQLKFDKGDYLDPYTAESSRQAVADYYRNKGYAFATVTVDEQKLSTGQFILHIEEGTRVKIAAVNFSGNSELKTKTLRKSIKTKTKKFLILSTYYNAEKIDDDILLLEKLYQRRGYRDSSVHYETAFNTAKDKVRITFQIKEGRRYRLGDIVLVGNKHFPDKRLREILPQPALPKPDKPSQFYNQRKIDRGRSELLKLYRQAGFVDVSIEQSIKFASPGEVNVQYSIEECERFRIGQIDITGNTQTQDKVIRRILDEYDFKPGNFYNAHIAAGTGQGELEETVRRNILSELTTIEPRGGGPRQKNALVNIKEGQTGMVMLGAGVGSDSGVIGQLVLEQKNFDIKDTPEDLREFITGNAFKGAGQRLRVALEPGTELSRYSVSFTEPYFRDKPVSLDITGLSYKRDRESYDENRLRGMLGFEKRYKNGLRKGVSFRIENVKIDDLESDTPTEVIDDKGDNFLAGIKFSIGKDKTDNRFNPTAGYNTQASYEQLGGDHTFGILEGIYRNYKTIHEDLLGRKTVLATKLLAATTVGDAPVFEKFYAGGNSTYGIRGFDYRGISPRGNPGDDPIGSDWIFLANGEVSVPIVGETLSGLFFVDSGAVESGGYRASMGIGVEIMLPQWFGPVPMRFELAAPFLKNEDDDTQVFSFSIGRLF